MARILILEDDVALNRMLCLILRTAGHEAVGAHSSDEAFEALDPWPDIITLDIGIPGVNGPTFLAEAVERGFKGRALIVSGSSKARETAWLMGEAFLEKPFDPDVFLKSVEDLLEEPPTERS